MKIKRNIMRELIAWKKSEDRMPLIIRGARQVGKSYILKQFGEREFSNFIHLDFEKDREKLSKIFSQDLSFEKILFELSLAYKAKINPQSDLLIFDEIQNCPRALTSLKYFCEDIPELAICCAGSLLGILLSEESFPVGKVEFIDMYPVTFEEFIGALEGDKVLDLYKGLPSVGNISPFVHDTFLNYLKEFYVVGGMPAVVSEYVSKRKEDKYSAIVSARKKQKDLILTYENDFIKHSGKLNAFHISSVFNSIVTQLYASHDTSVKRYKFNKSIPGKKGFNEIIGPIDWLEKAGLVIKVPVTNHADHPLKSFTKPNIFKLLIFDIGILGAMIDLDPNVIFSENYGIAKGYFVENFVACELQNNSYTLYSWNSKNHEIEFVLNLSGKIVPVEVKAARLSRSKSLEFFMERYKISTAAILSIDNGVFASPVLKIPLYLVGKIGEIVGNTIKSKM